MQRHHFILTALFILSLVFCAPPLAQAQTGMVKDHRAASVTTVQGTIISIKKSSLTFTVNGVLYTVPLAQSTKYANRNGKAITFSFIKAGHTIQVRGRKNTATKTISNVTKVVDQTLPKVIVSPSTISVAISDFAFSPAALTVKKGTKVTWTNNDAASHTVTGNAGSELSSETLSPGSTFAHTFATPGAFPYHCGFHSGMTGTVDVSN